MAGTEGADMKAPALSPEAEASIVEAYGKVPLYFIENKGQVDDKVRYYERGSGHATFFTADGVYLNLFRTKGEAPSFKAGLPEEAPEGKAETIRLSLAGANKSPEITAEGLQEGRVNYFTGDDSSKWRTDVPTYSRVVYKEVYEGIDIQYYGNNSSLEYDVIVRPGADYRDVRFAYEGIKGLGVTVEGDLEIALNEDKVIQRRPYIYQDIDGRRVEVEGSFKIIGEDASGAFTYGFEVASYDKGHDLVIDPVMVYSTYLGGVNYETGYDIAVDSTGCAYITGNTNSKDFSTVSAAQTVNNGAYDAFIVKLNFAGNGIVYATYLGGSGNDSGNGIAVDSSGKAYVVGHTASQDFPVSSTAPQRSNRGGFDAFVAKLGSTGNSLVYSTLLGGGSDDYAKGIAVDSSGNAHVAGYTYSTNFPVMSPYQSVYKGSSDAFLTIVSSTGTSLTYSTYFGGSISDSAYGIALDAAGNIYLAGNTTSPNFPKVSAYQSTLGGSSDAFVAKLGSGGKNLVYSTYLGGNGAEYAYDVAVDSSGNAYVTGSTSSANFPTRSPYQSILSSVPDAFVAKLAPAGNSLVYSTYLGGNGNDAGNSIAVDALGNAYVGGKTASANFPTLSGVLAGGYDAFIAKLASYGSAMLYSTFIGGSGGEEARGIALDSHGNAYIAGQTSSTNFPVRSAVQPLRGVQDAFVTKLSSAIPALTYPNTPQYGTDGVDPNIGTTSTDFTYKVIYKHLGNAAPSYVKTCIDNVCSPMTRDSSAPSAMRNGNYTDGEQYSYKTKLAIGSHSYYFTAYDGSETVTLSGQAGVNVNDLKITTSTLPGALVSVPYSTTLTATGGNGMYSWSAPAGLPSGLALDELTGALTGTLQAGSYGFQVCVSDSNNYKYCKDFTLTAAADSAAPAGAVSINGGAASTNTVKVTLGLSATDNSGTVTEMRLSNSSTGWPAWEPYAATKAWSLLNTSGAKTVYAQFRDAAGNVSSSVSDAISLTEAGTISINNGAASTSTAAVTLTIAVTDGSFGANQMRFSAGNGSTWTAWEALAASKAWTLAGAAGTKTVHVQFRNSSNGNVSARSSDTIQLTAP